MTQCRSWRSKQRSYLINQTIRVLTCRSPTLWGSDSLTNNNARRVYSLWACKGFESQFIQEVGYDVLSNMLVTFSDNLWGLKMILGLRAPTSIWCSSKGRFPSSIALTWSDGVYTEGRKFSWRKKGLVEGHRLSSVNIGRLVLRLYFSVYCFYDTSDKLAITPYKWDALEHLAQCHECWFGS